MRINDWKLSLTGKLKPFILPALAALALIFPELGATTPDVQVALWPMLIPLLGTIGGTASSIYGASRMGRLSDEQKRTLEAQKSLAQWKEKQGRESWAKFQEALKEPESFYSALLSGDRQTLMDVFGGDVNTIRDIYGQAGQELERTVGRGGALDVARSRMGMDQAGDIAGLFTGKQGVGATGMQGIADLYSQASSDQFEGAAQDYANLASQYQAQAQARQANSLGLGNILGQVWGGLMPELLKGFGAKTPLEGITKTSSNQAMNTRPVFKDSFLFPNSTSSSVNLGPFEGLGTNRQGV
jgi:hypothetical protein